MLTLSRKLGQIIVIGEEGNIRIEIKRIRPNEVRIAIQAPDHIPVHRLEIFERIEKTRESVNNQFSLQ